MTEFETQMLEIGSRIADALERIADVQEDSQVFDEYAEENEEVEEGHSENDSDNDKFGEKP